MQVLEAAKVEERVVVASQLRLQINVCSFLLEIVFNMILIIIIHIYTVGRSILIIRKWGSNRRSNSIIFVIIILGAKDCEICEMLASFLG